MMRNAGCAVGIVVLGARRSPRRNRRPAGVNAAAARSNRLRPR